MSKNIEEEMVERISNWLKERGHGSKTELARELGYEKVNGLTMALNRKRIQLELIPKICDFFHKTPDELFGYATNTSESRRDTNALIECEFKSEGQLFFKYQKNSQLGLLGEQLNDAQKGIEIFEYILKKDIDLDPSNLGLSEQRDLAKKLRLALATNAVRISHVEQNSGLEDQIMNKYRNKLKPKNIIVAALPKRNNALPIILRTELVAFLASKKIQPVSMLGVGWGYEMQRFAQLLHTAPEACLSLCAMKNDGIESYGYSANTACMALSQRFLIKSFLLPYQSIVEPTSTLNRLIKNSAQRKNKMGAIVLAINGWNSKSEHILMDTADGLFNYSEILSIVKNLSEDDKKFACEILGWVINKDGEYIQDSKGEILLDDEHFSIELDVLKQTCKDRNVVWMIGAGAQRAGATHTAIINGYVNSLAIDAELAEHLISLND